MWSGGSETLVVLERSGQKIDSLRWTEMTQKVLHWPAFRLQCIPNRYPGETELRRWEKLCIVFGKSGKFSIAWHERPSPPDWVPLLPLLLLRFLWQ
jgi:hypothetical protein